MNYTDVIKRTFRITWTYRPLATILLLGTLAMLSGSGVGIFFSTDVDNAGRNAVDTLNNALGQAGSYHVSYGVDSQLCCSATTSRSFFLSQR